MTDHAHHAPELRDLVQALGPLIAHVQLLTTTPTGFMVRMSKDTPRPALEAAYVAFDRHADHLRTQAAAKATPPVKAKAKASNPKQRRAAP
ncbi:MAG: hypothetical protein JZU52_18990 [Lamprocystis purpurea]|nr:hypothetical protein [Lamprocystis purpurea]